MNNLELYDKVRTVPQNAIKLIQAGRLKGKSDINPMWRLKTLTEHFGVCGIGWRYVITKQWLEQGANGEIGAFVNIDLYIKVDGEWSEAIPGTGGSMYVANEKNGPYTSDECYKMALTDAISVACKALGVAADVYWDSDRLKYDRAETPTKPQQQKPTTTPPQQQKADAPSEAQLKKIYALSKEKNIDPETMIAIMQERYGKEKSKDLTKKEVSDLITFLEGDK